MFTDLVRKRPSNEEPTQVIPTVETNQPVEAQRPTMRFTYGNGDQPLAGYTIKRGVGIGGFGEVYFAITEAGKEVALKRIQRNLDVEVRGVKQCINLRHPNLVGLYDIRFDDSGQGWIVMEYIAGKNLREVLDFKPDGLESGKALEWFSHLSAGVAYLHDQGIVHRDLKPGNIFLDGELVKIGDYGLSKFISCSRRGGQTESVGTFHYMAPEIGKGEYGKEIDIYALGIILYEMLTGNVPFDGESSQEIILKHLTADPNVSMLHPKIASVVAKCLAKNPTSRFGDVRDMLEPLGYEIQASGVAVPKSGNPLETATASGSSPPVLQPWIQPAASDPWAQPVANESPVASAEATNQNRAEQPVQAKLASDANGFAQNVESAAYYYREPIARTIQKTSHELSSWWNGVDISAGWKTVAMVGIIVLIVFNSQFLIGLLFMGLLMYVPYYIIWYLFASKDELEPMPNSGNPTQHRNKVVAKTGAVPPQSPAAPPNAPRVANLQPVVAKVQLEKKKTGRPITFKAWQSAQRVRLGTRTKTERLSARTSGMVAATGVVSVLSVIGYLAALATDRQGVELQSAAAWTAVMVCLSACGIIWFAKSWESEEEDGAVFRFKQLALGLVLGAIGFGLSQFLLVPWTDVHEPEILSGVSPQYWHGFYDETDDPILPAFLAYFAVLFGIARWWRNADAVRKRRFSFFSVFAAIVFAGIAHCIVPFPQPWGMILAGGIAVTTQLASKWIDSSDRKNLDAVNQILAKPENVA